MKTTEVEVKAIAKAVKASLTRQGHDVPHSNVLNALASALNKRDWQTLKASITPGQTVTATQSSSKKSETVALLESYSDRTRFLIRFAYLCDVALKEYPKNDDEAAKQALQNLNYFETRGTNCLLRWNNWTVLGKVSMNTSEIEAAEPYPETNLLGALQITTKKGELSFEVAFTRDTPDNPRWYITKAGAASAYEQLEGRVPLELLDTKQLPGPSVMAELWTDDRRCETSFDAQPYFQTASDKALREIKEVGFTGDYCTDAVAEHFKGSALYPEIDEAFEYLSHLPSRLDCGFECRVSAEDYYRWMEAHKPALLAKMLCQDYGVTVFQSTNTETKDMWDWTCAEQGAGSEISFDSEEEAYLDALRSLDLVTTAIAEAP